MSSQVKTATSTAANTMPGPENEAPRSGEVSVGEERDRHGREDHEPDPERSEERGHPGKGRW